MVPIFKSPTIIPLHISHSFFMVVQGSILVILVGLAWTSNSFPNELSSDALLLDTSIVQDSDSHESVELKGEECLADSPSVLETLPNEILDGILELLDPSSMVQFLVTIQTIASRITYERRVKALRFFCIYTEPPRSTDELNQHIYKHLVNPIMNRFEIQGPTEPETSVDSLSPTIKGSLLKGSVAPRVGDTFEDAMLTIFWAIVTGGSERLFELLQRLHKVDRTRSLGSLSPYAGDMLQKSLIHAAGTGKTDVFHTFIRFESMFKGILESAFIVSLLYAIGANQVPVVCCILDWMQPREHRYPALLWDTIRASTSSNPSMRALINRRYRLSRRLIFRTLEPPMHYRLALGVFSLGLNMSVSLAQFVERVPLLGHFPLGISWFIFVTIAYWFLKLCMMTVLASIMELITFP